MRSLCKLRDLTFIIPVKYLRRIGVSAVYNAIRKTDGRYGLACKIFQVKKVFDSFRLVWKRFENRLIFALEKFDQRFLEENCDWLTVKCDVYRPINRVKFLLARWQECLYMNRKEVVVFLIWKKWVVRNKNNRVACLLCQTDLCSILYNCIIFQFCILVNEIIFIFRMNNSITLNNMVNLTFIFCNLAYKLDYLIEKIT